MKKYMWFDGAAKTDRQFFFSVVGFSLFILCFDHGGGEWGMVVVAVVVVVLVLVVLMGVVVLVVLEAAAM